MLFTSYISALFVALAFCVYYVAGRASRGRRPQNLALLILSYVFYALWDWRWCLLLVDITTSGFLAGLLLEQRSAKPRLIHVATLFVNLAALGAFKYFQFFAESFASLRAKMGLHADSVTLNLVLTIGLSYYVFQHLERWPGQLSHRILRVGSRQKVAAHGLDGP